MHRQDHRLSKSEDMSIGDVWSEMGQNMSPIYSANASFDFSIKHQHSKSTRFLRTLILYAINYGVGAEENHRFLKRGISMSLKYCGLTTIQASFEKIEKLDDVIRVDALVE